MFKQVLSVALWGSLLAGCGGAMYESEDDSLRGAVGGGGGKTSKTSTVAPTYVLKTTDAHVSGVEPVWKSAFSVTNTYEIYFANEITGTLSGHHTQSVYVITPGGSTYLRIDTAFATDVAASSGEQQAEKTATGWRVWSSMPVAGTAIDMYKMTGTWRADLFIDTASTRNATVDFTLQ